MEIFPERLLACIAICNQKENIRAGAGITIDETGRKSIASRANTGSPVYYLRKVNHDEQEQKEVEIICQPRKSWLTFSQVKQQEDEGKEEEWKEKGIFY